MLASYLSTNAKIDFRLNTMDEVFRSHKQEADKLEHDIDDSQMSIVNCEASIPKLEERFRFFQEMRGYVRDLVECLNEKVGSLYMLGWPTVLYLHIVCRHQN